MLSVPIDGDETTKETTIDDFDNDDDDWGLDDIKSDSQDSESKLGVENSETPEVPKGPVSYIQKIPRRGEKPSTELPPVEIAAVTDEKKISNAEDETVNKRDRRDALTREQRKEQKRLAKKNKNKENGQSLAPEQTESHTNPTSTKRPRKQKQQKKQKQSNTEDEVAPANNGGTKKQRQGGKKNKEGKQKNREGRPTGSSRQLQHQQQQGQSKNNGQRNRKQRPTKHQQQPEGTLQ